MSGARRSVHVAVPTAADIVQGCAARGDIVTSADGAVALYGSDGPELISGGPDSGRSYQVRALIDNIGAPHPFTLSGDANTLTATGTGALGTYLSLGYTLPVGSAVLVLVDGAADGLWLVSVEGNGGTAGVLTRNPKYRTGSSLPQLVTLVSPIAINGVAPSWVCVGTAPTPGSAALPYVRTDGDALYKAKHTRPEYVSPLSALGPSVAVLTQVLRYVVSDATQDLPLTIPWACELLEVASVIDVTAALSSWEVRTAGGGGGTIVGSALDSTVRGRVPESGYDAQIAFVGNARVLSAGTLYLHRTSVTTRGALYLTVVRTA